MVSYVTGAAIMFELVQARIWCCGFEAASTDRMTHTENIYCTQSNVFLTICLKACPCRNSDPVDAIDVCEAPTFP